MSSELSGVDLARQALLAAREAARKSGATGKKPKHRAGMVVRRGGREPLGLGAAIGLMMTERGMVAPAVGGSVLAQFDAILAKVVPELAGRVRAVGFDADGAATKPRQPRQPRCAGPGPNARPGKPEQQPSSRDRLPCGPPPERAATSSSYALYTATKS
ncbi:hypothetical protein [Streptomyces sp. NPDC056323]|uniref:hypothetical protein n=1 Tax=Streptomyces sp. NPDC056323 TaxID=3345784 RepID=UPI0035DD6491